MTVLHTVFALISSKIETFINWKEGTRVYHSSTVCVCADKKKTELQLKVVITTNFNKPSG